MHAAMQAPVVLRENCRIASRSDMRLNTCQDFVILYLCQAVNISNYKQQSWKLWWQVIQLEEVLAPTAPPDGPVNYTDLDLSDASLNPSPVIVRPAQSQQPSTDYAIIDFEATSAAARAGRDHVRRREDCRSAAVAQQQ